MKYNNLAQQNHADIIIKRTIATSDRLIKNAPRPGVTIAHSPSTKFHFMASSKLAFFLLWGRNANGISRALVLTALISVPKVGFFTACSHTRQKCSTLHAIINTINYVWAWLNQVKFAYKKCKYCTLPCERWGLRQHASSPYHKYKRLARHHCSLRNLYVNCEGGRIKCATKFIVPILKRGNSSGLLPFYCCVSLNEIFITKFARGHFISPSTHNQTIS